MARLVNIGVKPERTSARFAEDQIALEQQRALAEQLMAMSQQPNEAKMVGGRYIDPGWAGAAFKALQGGLAGMAQGGVRAYESSLAERRAKAAEDWINQMPQGTPAMPAQPEMGPPTEEGQMQPGVPAQAAAPPSRQDIAKWALQGADINPSTGKIAEQALAQLTATPKVPEGSLHTIYKDGKPQQVMLDKQGNVIKELGEGKPDAPSTLQQNAEYMAKTLGVPVQQALAYLQKSQDVLPTDQGPMVANRGALYPGMFPPGGGAGPGGPGNLPPQGPQKAAGVPAQVPPGLPLPPGQDAAPPAPAGGMVPAPVPPGAAAAPPPLIPKPFTGGPVPGYDYDKKQREAEAAKAVASKAKLDTDVEQYGKAVAANSFPEFESALKDVEDMIAKKGDKNIEGVGYLTNVLPGMGKEAQSNQLLAQRLKNIKVRAQAGLSQTAPELANAIGEIGLGATQSEATFREAIGHIRSLLDAHNEKVNASYSPEVRSEFEKRQRINKLKERLGQ